jgi:ABC-type transporter Mla subunit MlaD
MMDDLNAYRDRMAAEHKRFSDAVMAMLTEYGRTQTVFSDLVRDVDTLLRGLRKSDDELKRLILEQGQQIADLRRRLDGHS